MRKCIKTILIIMFCLIVFATLIGHIFSPLIESKKNNIFIEAELIKIELGKELNKIMPDYEQYEINFVFKRYKRENLINKGIIKGQYLYELISDDKMNELIVCWEKNKDAYQITKIKKVVQR
jgi:lipopolysaccharide export LptBFGC system permease protein LptF